MYRLDFVFSFSHLRHIHHVGIVLGKTTGRMPMVNSSFGSSKTMSTVDAILEDGGRLSTRDACTALSSVS
jgi:hypothetical protein